MIASVPSFGLTPSRILAPPMVSMPPGSRHSNIRQRHALGAGVLRHRFTLHEVVDSGLNKEAAEYQATEQEGSFHWEFLLSMS